MRSVCMKHAPARRGLGPEGPVLLLPERASSMGFHAGISLWRSDLAGEAIAGSLPSFRALDAAYSRA